MKLQSNQSSTQPTTFETPHQAAILWNPGPDITYAEQVELMRPKPPTSEMVERAQFIDKTYVWKNAGIRPRK